jgi:hypothetical protein
MDQGTPVVTGARIVEAKGFWKFLLRRFQIAAIVMPWRTVYIAKPYLNHEGLIAHEMVHIEQINRDGPIAFSVKYLWWLATKGYAENPYEIEAYAKAPLE